MRRIILLMLIFLLLPVKVQASDYTVPTVPTAGEKYMPNNTESLGQGLWEIFNDAVSLLHPTITEASSVCISLVVISLILSIINNTSSSASKTTSLIGSLAVSSLLFNASHSLIELASNTVRQVSDYGKLLIPVMTGALAASGGGNTAVALYTGTIIFDGILSSLVSSVLIPMVYIYLALSTANSATGERVLTQLRDFSKWLMTWALKLILYTFTGFIGITRVVSGNTDAVALKITKLSISGMVPMVGGILSDASESVIASAGIMKNAAGIYGILAVAAITLEPFIRIAIQYLMVKITAAICSVFAPKETSGLIQNFSTALGFLLAMTGSVCVMLLISTVCFMKGVS